MGLLNPEQKLMIQKRQWKNLGFTDKEIKEMENARFRGLISEEITKIRMESKESFFKGIIVGALFGLLGNLFITTIFRVIDNPNCWNSIYFVSALIGVAFCLWIVDKELKKHKVDKD